MPRHPAGAAAEKLIAAPAIESAVAIEAVSLSLNDHPVTLTQRRFERKR
jgi:hypothetical protein